MQKDRIYHYTTEEALKKILESKTIKFTALNYLDDLLEGYNVDFDNMSKFIYTSCWTYDKAESIPLWYMYSNQYNGIRIEADGSFLELIKDRNSGKVLNITDKNIIVFPFDSNNFLDIVKYTDNYESCIKNMLGMIDNNYYDIGKIKPIAWKFKNEIRYRVIGMHKNELEKFGDTLFQKLMNAVINNGKNCIKDIFIKFKIEKFINANFLLGPKCDDNDFNRLNDLIRNTIPKFSGKIEKSRLKIRFNK